jgi:hypothetical protein
MPDGFTASVGERLPGNVRYWHKADMPSRLAHVRFEE